MDDCQSGMSAELKIKPSNANAPSAVSIMPMPKSKSYQTGPKSAQGKARASKNAVTHGLSAMVHESPGEFGLAQAYTKQLLEHYQPNSPLESLQVIRVARTWAKLEMSYEQERAKLALALYEFESSPSNVTSSMKEGSDLELSLARRLLDGQSLSLPFSICEEEVTEVAKESRGLKGQVTCDMDFEKRMPKLFNLVNNIELSSLDGLQEGASVMDRLKIIARDVEVIFSHHGLDGAIFFNVLEKLSRFRSDEKSGQMSSPRREHIKYRDEEEPNKIHDAFVAQVRLFVRLSDSLDKAKSLVEKVREHRQLKRASISLSPDESDRFARYQANLERRLSSQIGELRVMQADKVRLGLGKD